jgi:hypothetical protein
MKSKIQFLSIFTLLLTLVFIYPAQAQDETLKLRLGKDFGFNAGSQMQGVFSMSAKGPDSVIRVVFYIDDQVLGEDSEAPFKIQFSTDSYPLGMHSLHATGYTSTGEELQSNVLEMEFVSASQGWQSTMRILGPLLVILALVFGISILTIVLGSRKRLNPAPGTPRKYGFAGGSICPKCSRPTPLHMMGLNLGLSKFDRCENCGKWSAMRARPLVELRQAEEDELARAKAEESASLANLSDADEKLKKDLDNSRYVE